MTDQMKIFLTGASGYVGRHVALELLSRGHEVVGLARQPSERTEYSPDVQWCFGDLSAPSTYALELGHSDAVVHCAMDYSSSGENAELDRQFVDRMEDFEGHFVYTGNLFSHRRAGPLGESLATESDHWRFQTEVAAFGRAGASSVIRLGFVYGGSGGYFWQIMSPGTLAALNGRAIPDVQWPMVHVRDVASLYATVLETAGEGVFHAYDGVRLCARDVVELTRAVYESRGISDPDSHDYIQSLLKASVMTSNQRSRSIGWSPRHPSFPESAELAYSESTNRST